MLVESLGSMKVLPRYNRVLCSLSGRVHRFDIGMVDEGSEKPLLDIIASRGMVSGKNRVEVYRIIW